MLSAYQVAQAQVAEEAVDLMLAQQDIDAQVDALLNTEAFRTSSATFEQMFSEAEMDWQLRQLVASLTQDAGRAAEGVAIAARPNIGHVRMLNPPSCARCAVLAGRVYRYSDGFLRHPGDDCVMIPTTLANPDFTQDPVDLMERGLIGTYRTDKKTGRRTYHQSMSKADMQAVKDGADFNQVVNVRLRKSGLIEAGRSLSRRGRPTPEAIYRRTDTREEALAALQSAGYVR